MKKNFLFANLLILLASCNQGDEKPVSIETTVKKDSALPATKPQVSHYTIPDLSPMDMIYYPADYPLKKMSGNIISAPLARIIYSRPQTQRRKIFGELVKYNQPWRLGANESTEIEFFSPATIQNKTIKPGRYILYCIPQETKWTIVLNSNIYSWGLKQDSTKDLLQFDCPLEKNNTIIEYFTMSFEGEGKNALLLILWDNVKTNLAIKF